MNKVFTMEYWKTFGIILISVLFSVWVTEAKPTLKPDILIGNILLPGKCDGFDICSKPFNATLQKIVDDIIKRKNLTVAHRRSSKYWPNIVERESLKVTERECSSKGPLTKKAYYIWDVTGKLRVVVQSKKLFMQSIEMTECKDTKPRSNAAHWNALIGHIKNLYCDQRYIDYKYLVLNEGLNDTEFVSVRKGVPVACAFIYKN